MPLDTVKYALGGHHAWTETTVYVYGHLSTS